MRIYLETLGCRLNYAEMAALGRSLARDGHALAASPAEAELCVLNTCAVTGEAARQSRQLARQMVRANPSAQLVVTGCYAALEAEAAAALPNVRLVVGNAAKDNLRDLIRGLAAPVTGSRAAGPPAERAGPLMGAAQPRTRAFVKVQDGCRNQCTFCIVTKARGSERSRPIAEVIAEINALHGDGYQEAVLTGVHLGGYGSDMGYSLHDLLAALLSETRIPRLRLSSLEPFDIAPDFFDLWPASNGRLMPHLHLPAQSGADRVLRRMARRHRASEFTALADAARERIAGLTITTDLIAGFPGETAGDFDETVAFARRNSFAHLHVFPYSARAGTASAGFPDQVPGPERRARARVLTELSIELGRSVREAFIGQLAAVLWEGPQPIAAGREAASSAAGETTWTGLTGNYLRVRTAVPAGTDLRNRITVIRLTQADGNDLWGEIQSPGGEHHVA